MSTQLHRRSYLTHKPLIRAQFAGPGPGVEHQMQVGYSGKHVRCRQISQQVINGVMEPAVHENGQHDQDVGEDHEATDKHSERDNRNVLGPPGFADILFAKFVEKTHTPIAVANPVFKSGHRSHLVIQRKCDR